jgi:glutamyl-tRNA reductase
MKLIACGINYKTAELAVRERVAFSPEKTAFVLRELTQNGCAREAVLLSTCNRTEVYCVAENHTPIIGYLAEQGQFKRQQLFPHSYAYYDLEAVSHVTSVASGLRSMVVGEPQILGQLKQAVSFAESQGTCRSDLRRLFQHVFSSAKIIRTKTLLGDKPLSFAYVIAFLAKRIFADLSSLNVMLVGSGEMIAQAARHFYSQKVRRIWISNRTLTKAVQLSEKFSAQAISFSQIADYLSQADIVVCATASPIPILGKGAVESALKLRKHKPILMVDLAVPRDIEPEVEQLEDIYLYTIDHLQSIIADHLSTRICASVDAEKIVHIQTARFMQQLQALQSVDAIKTLRNKIDAMRDEELRRALRKLNGGALPQDALAEMARRMSRKFLHHPSVALRKTSIKGDRETLNALKQLLDLQYSS